MTVGRLSGDRIVAHLGRAKIIVLGGIVQRWALPL